MKTQPCPACGKELATPREYFPALAKMRNEVEKYGDVLIANHEFSLNERVKELESAIQDFIEVYNQYKDSVSYSLQYDKFKQLLSRQ